MRSILQRRNPKDTSPRSERASTSSGHTKQDIADHGSRGGRQGQQSEDLNQELPSAAEEIRCLGDYEIQNTIGRGMSGT